MNTVKYNGRMTEKEIFRYAYHKMLEVDKEDLYEMIRTLVDAAEEDEYLRYSTGFDDGYEEGYDAAVVEMRSIEQEVRFDPIP